MADTRRQLRQTARDHGWAVTPNGLGWQGDRADVFTRAGVRVAVFWRYIDGHGWTGPITQAAVDGRRIAAPMRAKVTEILTGHPEGITAGTVTEGYSFAGALRENGTVVWTCDHLHRDRDEGRGGRVSARECAAAQLAHLNRDPVPLTGADRGRAVQAGLHPTGTPQPAPTYDSEGWPQ